MIVSVLKLQIRAQNRFRERYYVRLLRPLAETKWTRSGRKLETVWKNLDWCWRRRKWENSRVYLKGSTSNDVNFFSTFAQAECFGEQGIIEVELLYRKQSEMIWTIQRMWFVARCCSITFPLHLRNWQLPFFNSVIRIKNSDNSVASLVCVPVDELNYQMWGERGRGSLLKVKESFQTHLDCMNIKCVCIQITNVLFQSCIQKLRRPAVTALFNSVQEQSLQAVLAFFLARTAQFMLTDTFMKNLNKGK